MKTIKVPMLNFADVPEPLANMIEDRYGTEYRKALMSSDVVLLQGVLSAAWKFYLSRTTQQPMEFYDAVTNKLYGNKLFSPGTLLYKEYFGVLPPVQTREAIDDTVNKYGLTPVSTVYAEWRENKWNPRNIYGMMEKVRKDAKEYPSGGSVAQVFLDEE